MAYKVGQYHYVLRGRFFRIYKCTSVSDTGSSSSLVIGEPSFTDRELARQRVYQLNGWKYRQ